MNVIYHYYPRFREPIFKALARQSATVQFIYGRNSRFGVAALTRAEDDVRRNLFVGNVILQSFGLSTLSSVCRQDSVILGDIKYVNSWFYAVLGRLCGRKIYFWTHGLLAPESGLKWRIRKAYYNLAHGLLLYSNHEVKLLREMGYRKTLTSIGNSNFSKREVAALLSQKQLEGRGRDICYVGRISDEKGLKAFIEFAESNPSRRVVLVGPVGPVSNADLTRPKNLFLFAPEYEFSKLAKVTEGCGALVMFTAAGLTLFTAMVLDKRIFVKRLTPQKPEYHILSEYGLINSFDSYGDLLQQIETNDLNDSDFQSARNAFLAENTGEEVARRLVLAVDSSRGLSEC